MKLADDREITVLKVFMLVLRFFALRKSRFPGCSDGVHSVICTNERKMRLGVLVALEDTCNCTHKFSEHLGHEDELPPRSPSTEQGRTLSTTLTCTRKEIHLLFRRIPAEHRCCEFPDHGIPPRFVTHANEASRARTRRVDSTGTRRIVSCLGCAGSSGSVRFGDNLGWRRSLLMQRVLARRFLGRTGELGSRDAQRSHVQPGLHSAVLFPPLDTFFRCPWE